jgi:tetratricopeptide (TPR) repeat protein/tRNA A-37 threonylcarbamoyl transferase component Bud32
MSLSSGTRLGSYEIVSAIGAGGMGEVYKARDTRLDRIVALKLSRDEYSERFAREARAIAALNHPGICTLHDVGPNYLVLEFIDGERLKGPLPAARVVKYAAQIADALDAAHAQGVIHRDIKPSNVFVTSRGHTKVLDFGLATLAELRVEQGTQAVTEQILTSPGSTPGTVSYMSPEQARGDALDARTDLWSLGVLLYEAITGVRPFTGATSAVVFEAILNKSPAPLDDPGIPAELQRIVFKLLEKDRSKRYRSAAELRDDLARLEQELSTSRSAVRSASPSRAWWKRAAAVAILAVLAAGGLFIWQRTQAAPLTDQDVLVLADFTNTTGDPVFDVTLREALAIQLEESPFLKVLDDGRVQRTLEQMGRKRDERITNEIAREICVRTGEKAMLSGAIAAVGASFAITLRAVDCQSEAVLARAQAEAADKERVLATLAEAALEIRGKLGESLASIQRVPQWGDDVTTSSLAAFQAYSLGREQMRMGFDREAIPHLERAIELDADFAFAYANLSVRYSNLGDERLAREHARKAFALIDRASEQERLRISGVYHMEVTGDLEKAAQLYQQAADMFPRVGSFRNSLGVIYGDLGDRERAISEFQKAIELGPPTAVYFTNLMRTDWTEGRFDEARAVARQAAAQGFDGARLHQALLNLALIEGDAAAVERERQWFVGKPEEANARRQLALNARVLGQFRKAGELDQGRGGRGAPPGSSGPPGARRRGRGRGVFVESALGNCPPEERSRLREAAVSREDLEIEERIQQAVPLGLCGELELAERLAQEAAKALPSHTLMNRLTLPMVRAAIELGRNQPAKAIEMLRPASRFELVNAQLLTLRAIANMRAGNPAEAAADYQKILDRRSRFWTPLYPQAMVGLARAFAQAGDTARAKRAYESFFEFWKDADADAPLLVAARKEYAGLKQR